MVAAGRFGLASLALVVVTGGKAGEPASLPVARVPDAVDAARPAAWVSVPRVLGRVKAAQFGLVINRADPYSVEVGQHYARTRQLAPEQVLQVDLPLQSHLSAAELEALRRRIDGHFGPGIQALVLAWSRPYAVSCMSITSALAFGVDEDLCRNPCGKSSLSPYFNSASDQPLRDHGFRPAMLLAAGSAPLAHALIDRGAGADGTLGLRGGLPAEAWFIATRDAARNVRAALFPPAGLLRSMGVQVALAAGELPPAGRSRVLLVQTGLAQLGELGSIGWLPGALADHLTSFGGVLDGSRGQTSATAWIDAGATASYGTVSEPCNHPQKFPHPQLLLLHYLQGESALEAYWKSVAWPQQGVFIGDPLAAPFARR
jgi:uncharacterized protein (TIGR03790 family)